MLIIYIFFPISYKEGEIKQTFFSHILNSAAIAQTNTWDTFCGDLSAHLVSVLQDDDAAAAASATYPQPAKS